MTYPDPNRPDVLARVAAGFAPYVLEPGLNADGEPGEIIHLCGYQFWRPVPVFSAEDYTAVGLAVPAALMANAPEDAPMEAGAYPDSPHRDAGCDDAVGPPLGVAPAEAGAHPDSPHGGGGGFDAVSPDGPLPSGEMPEVHPEPVAGQGRRDEGCAEPADAQGPRDVGERADRPLRHNEFSPARRAMFLHHLAEQGTVRVAAAKVGICPQSAYVARRRDANFRAGWDAALVLAREYSAQVLANCALDGVREAVWYRGELVGEKVRIDARLLLAHLGRLDARAGNRQAQAHAERFDEILALVAGEDFADELVDRPTERGQADADPILPATRAALSDLAASAVWDDNGTDDDEADRAKALAPQQREWAARDRAEARWDEWGMRVDIVNAAIEAGELPVVAEAMPEEDEEPPYEVKSLSMGSSRILALRRRCQAPWRLTERGRQSVVSGAWAAASVSPGGPPSSPEREGSDSFPRTL